jgi:hypothetical protein
MGQYLQYIPKVGPLLGAGKEGAFKLTQAGIATVSTIKVGMKIPHIKEYWIPGAEKLGSKVTNTFHDAFSAFTPKIG